MYTRETIGMIKIMNMSFKRSLLPVCTFAFLFACCPSVSRQPLVCFLSLFISLNCLKFYTNEIVQGVLFLFGGGILSFA